jgi:hypothetical protein
VTIRPAPDTMTYLTALLPVAQGVSVYAALRREADVCADGRSRGQVMADTLVERTTGRSAAAATPIAVNLVLSDETLFGGSSAPATVSGYGPIPAAVARDLVSGAVSDERSRAMLRRLYGSSEVRRPGGNGVQSPAVPTGVGGVHRATGSAMPHTVLRRTDPPPRPCAAVGRQRWDKRGQRARTMRTMQLRQRGRRLVRQTGR